MPDGVSCVLTLAGLTLGELRLGPPPWVEHITRIGSAHPRPTAIRRQARVHFNPNPPRDRSIATDRGDIQFDGNRGVGRTRRTQREGTRQVGETGGCNEMKATLLFCSLS